MAKQITKAELQAKLAEANAAYEAAHAALMAVSAERDELLHECEVMNTLYGGEQYRNEQLGKELRDVKAQLEAHATPSRRIAAAGYVAPAWQAARAEAMAKAKAMAMQIGRSVRVG